MFSFPKKEFIKLLITKDKLILLPIAGLANRIRAVNSVIELNKTLKKRLLILWVSESVLNCQYCSLFKENEHFSLIEEPLKYKFLWLNPACLSLPEKVFNQTFKFFVFDKVIYHNELRINNKAIFACISFLS